MTAEQKNKINERRVTSHFPLAIFGAAKNIYTSIFIVVHGERRTVKIYDDIVHKTNTNTPAKLNKQTRK